MSERTYRTPPLYRVEICEGIHEGALQKFEQTVTDALVAGWDLHGPPVVAWDSEGGYGSLGRASGPRFVALQALKRPLEEIHDRQETTGRKGAATRGTR